MRQLRGALTEQYSLLSKKEKEKEKEKTKQHSSLYLYGSLCFATKNRDTLFIPEKVFRINNGLNLHKPLKIVIEVLGPINHPFLKAILTKAVNPTIKIPIIQKRTSGILGHKRGHVTEQPLSLVCEI